jgi:uncharacterized repeat protein (TIGR01451 family)
MPGKRITGLAGAVTAAVGIGALLPAMALAPADLSITKSDNPDPVVEGQQLTYTIEVRNDGTDPAQNVVVSDDLPGSSDVDLVSTTPSQGSCSQQGNQPVTCDLGTIANDSTATIVLVVTTKKAGTITNTATVTSTDDPNPANNSVTEQTTVQPAPQGNPGRPPGSCQTATPTLSGTEGNDTLTGTTGNDVILALGGDDTIAGLGGRDLICGGSGNDTARGQADGDIVKGGGGNDRVKGGAANDKVGGGSGKDRVGGGSGNDALNGGTGKDRCNGGPGRDTERSC